MCQNVLKRDRLVIIFNKIEQIMCPHVLKIGPLCVQFLQNCTDRCPVFAKLHRLVSSFSKIEQIMCPSVPKIGPLGVQFWQNCTDGCPVLAKLHRGGVYSFGKIAPMWSPIGMAKWIVKQARADQTELVLLYHQE